MKQFYKGFDISVRNGTHYETGKKTVRVSRAVRRDDGWELSFYPSQGSTAEEMTSMRDTVDQFYKHPELYDAPKGNTKYPPAPSRHKKKDDDEQEE